MLHICYILIDNAYIICDFHGDNQVSQMDFISLSGEHLTSLSPLISSRYLPDVVASDDSIRVFGVFCHSANNTTQPWIIIPSLFVFSTYALYRF